MNGRHHSPPKTDRLKKRAADLTQHTRARLAAAVAAVALLAALALGSHQLGQMHANAGSERPHAAAKTVVKHETLQACVDALAHAEKAMDAAKQFGRSMEDFHAGALDLLTRGDTGTAVAKLQQYLNREAHSDLAIDGDYGPKTEKAVEAYREAQGRHKADSEEFLDALADTRQKVKVAARDCQLSGSGKPTRESTSSNRLGEARRTRNARRVTE